MGKKNQKKNGFVICLYNGMPHSPPSEGKTLLENFIVTLRGKEAVYFKMDKKNESCPFSSSGVILISSHCKLHFGTLRN